MLHWLAAARAELIPPAPQSGSVLVDLGCGAGLLAPHLEGKGYAHIGVDRSPSAIAQAAGHGVLAVRGDVLSAPLADDCADDGVYAFFLEATPEPFVGGLGAPVSPVAIK
jgi:2-polyprenyl-6-hydroxyphenyl methylase/3-demethylubiquinone-9 3-methyltransferase